MTEIIIRKSCSGWAEAQEHLARVDPRLATVIERVGPCTMAPRRDYFPSLCKALVSQQISTHVARVIYRRFQNLFPRSRPSPEILRTLSDTQLRTAGLSRQKASYLRSLADAFADGTIPTRRFKTMSDEEVIQSLIHVRGIGRWTAEMFLMFVLNRPDILPVDDLGLRKNYQIAFSLRKLPDAKLLIRRTEHWRPYRSVATWYLWRMQEVP